uniref:Uncharacterized protein n=1 Tax=Anguilla anguilla TaxID=7936 RepID=A0A0E9WWW8_ANGAN
MSSKTIKAKTAFILQHIETENDYLHNIYIFKKQSNMPSTEKMQSSYTQTRQN